MRLVTALLILALGALLGVLLAKVAFGLAALTGVTVFVIAVLLAGFFLARDGVHWARNRRET
jgi:uncharacterized membrane protein YoaK (UPF0700 family)